MLLEFTGELWTAEPREAMAAATSGMTSLVVFTSFPVLAVFVFPILTGVRGLGVMLESLTSLPDAAATEVEVFKSSVAEAV
jgi:TctA family transporter